ncbi:2-dehydro-3-deoxyglucarate aldolase [Pseudomonas putida]|nr:2-dehydro-3-deoxyglucarate aldolase [Pseudomonas putida]
MKQNKQKRSFLAQEPSVGCWLNLGSPAVAEALAHCGFDWLLIDCEHAPNDDNDVIHHLRAIDAARANGAAAEPIVRVAWNDHVMVKRVMDSGATTVMFPAIDNADQARKAVASTRFPEGGNGGVRGVAGLTRAGTYAQNPAYLAQANAQASAVVQIETAEGVRNVNEIAQVDGADCLFIGPADLAASLGFLGNHRHPDVLAAIDTVIKAGERFGKPVGIFASNAEEGAFYRSRGVKMIALNCDVMFLVRGALGELKEYKAGV